MADILATKLDVVMYRPKLRDYIDLAAIDRLSEYKLEDGIEFYRRKLGYDENPSTRIMRRIVGLMADPGQVLGDARLEDRRVETFDYLRRPSHNLVEYLSDISDQQMQNSAAITAEELGAPRGRGTAATGSCGHWMPRARARCVLPVEHNGPHRSSR